MILLLLAGLGLIFGSFINALVWRLHEPKLSVLRGRSMCPHCRHELAAKDLVPVLSWLSLRGRCRYCQKPISQQYPVVEAATAGLFVASYVWWPFVLAGSETIRFGFWLAFLVGLVALVVYDLRWMLLPHKIVYPLIGLAIVQWLVILAAEGLSAGQLRDIPLSALIGGGLFYGLFQLSGGKWIGGGDVKLGFLLGLLIGNPLQMWLWLFLASALGSLVTLPLMATGRATRRSRIPFGPFLIAAGIIVVLFGNGITAWLERFLLLS